MGSEQCLRGVANSFSTVMQCLAKCGVIDMEFFKHVTVNSNECAQLHMDLNSLLCGLEVDEYLTGGNDAFFGIVLKVSIDDRVGGYAEYFNDDIITDLADDYSIAIDGFSAWAKKVMTLCRFKQT